MTEDQIKRPRRYTTLRRAARTAKEMRARLECHPRDVLDLLNEVHRLRAQVKDALAAQPLLSALEEIRDYAKRDGDIIAQHLRGIAARAITKNLE